MPPPGQAPSQSTLALARRHQPNVKSTRGAQTSPTSTHQPGYPKTAPKTASITRSRPHHRKVHTRQRQQAVPQKARPRRAVATAEAKQAEVRSLRVGLQVAKQQQQRGNGSAAREVGGTNRKGAAPESGQVPGPRRGRGDAPGVRSSAPRGRCRRPPDAEHHAARGRGAGRSHACGSAKQQRQRGDGSAKRAK